MRNIFPRYFNTICDIHEMKRNISIHNYRAHVYVVFQKYLNQACQAKKKDIVNKPKPAKNDANKLICQAHVICHTQPVGSNFRIEIGLGNLGILG